MYIKNKMHLNKPLYSELKCNPGFGVGLGLGQGFIGLDKQETNMINVCKPLHCYQNVKINFLYQNYEQFIYIMQLMHNGHICFTTIVMYNSFVAWSISKLSVTNRHLMVVV